MPARFTLTLAALYGALAVLLGAFAAHALGAQLEPRLLAVFKTGVDYQFYHVFALLAVGLLQQRADSRWLRCSALLFGLGVVLFSGSLYLLALSGMHRLGMITPLGGVLFVCGWLALASALFCGERHADTGKR